jgi:hypothetical protein
MFKFRVDQQGEQLYVRLTVSGDGSVEQLWERVFAYQSNGLFSSVENPEFRLTFTPVEPRSTRVSLTLSGRAFGDATRVESPAGQDR